jgi:hypothetical protein
LYGGEKLDTLGRVFQPKGRVIRLSHNFNFGSQNYKFADIGKRPDSMIFNNFEIDRRGLRHFLAYSRLENSFSLTTFKSKSNGERADFISTGISHRFYKLNHEPFNSKFNNLFLIGSAAFTPSERFNFVVNGNLGLLKSTGEYQLNGHLKLGLGKVGTLTGGILSQRIPVDLLANRMLVNFQEVWNNDFLKPIQNSIYAAYTLPNLGFSMEGKTHLVSNYTYFDQNGLANQTTAPVQVAQLILHENIKWGILSFDNSVALQRFNRSDVLHLPTWFSRNSLYFAGRVFKKNLYMETGLQVNINSEFRADSYQPLNWQFNLQDTFLQKPYPMLDVFAGFKIKNFRIFVRYENLTAVFSKKDLFYSTNLYPSAFPAFRLGIRWRFLDTNLPGEEQKDQVPSGVGSGGGGFQRPSF